jgi:serine kinase of HPr protein (carbohydrate metabolism regulator)
LAKTIDFTIGVETVKERVFSRLTNQYETRDFVETQITFPGHAFEFRRALPGSENVLACSKVVVTGWVDAANELR